MRAALLALLFLHIPGCPKSSSTDAPDAAARASAAGKSAPPPASVASKPDAGAGNDQNDRAGVERATQLFEEIDELASKNTLKDPQRPDEPDAQARCASFESLRPKLEKRPEPEVKTMLDAEKRVSGFDVPLLVAEEAIRQLGFSGSQASKQLSCNVASKEIEKARAIKADDLKLRNVESRYRSICSK